MHCYGALCEKHCGALRRSRHAAFVCDLTSSNGFELYVRSPQEIAQEHWSIAQCKIDSFLESDFPLASCPRRLHYGDAAEQIVAAGGVDLARPLGHRQWACALAFNTDSARVLNLANHAAAEVGAKLLLVHVIEPNSGKDDCADEETAHRRLSELQSSLGCNLAIQVVRGPVEEALLNMARQASVDLLIIGRLLCHSVRRMRDLTYAIIRDSPCPVLSM